jgi:hypothetical protein
MSLKLSETDILNVLVAIWNDGRYRLAREHAHRQGHPAACDYITIAAQALQRENVARGGAWDDIGCNWRRAKIGDQSMDGLSVKNPADGRYYFEDVIASAGTPAASIKYRHPFRDEALLRAVAGGPYAPHGYADPRELRTHFPYTESASPSPSPPSPVPPPRSTAECKFDPAGIEAPLATLKSLCSNLVEQIDATREIAEAAKVAAEEARRAAEEARDEVRTVVSREEAAVPVYVSDRLPVIGTITLRPQP